jgi:hypothetical protein
MKLKNETLSNYELRDAINRTDELYNGSPSGLMREQYRLHMASLLAEQLSRAEAREELEDQP